VNDSQPTYLTNLKGKKREKKPHCMAFSEIQFTLTFISFCTEEAILQDIHKSNELQETQGKKSRGCCCTYMYFKQFQGGGWVLF
jgi:hypothetical protein